MAALVFGAAVIGQASSAGAVRLAPRSIEPAGAGVPKFTSATSATATVGTHFLFAIVTTPGPDTTLSQTGIIPTGLVFTPNDNANGTAVLAGTPIAGDGGKYKITLKAVNSAGSATEAFNLTVDEAPTITTAPTVAATVGKRLKFTVGTTGFPTPTVAETGALPEGLSFTANDKGMATISGTPAAGSGGTYDLTISAANGVSPPATQNFVLTFDQLPAFTSTTTATATIPEPFTYTVYTTGVPTPKLTESGVLPQGLVFTANDNGTATLSGTVPTGPGGNFKISLTATNSAGSTTEGFTLVVDQPPAITSTGSATTSIGRHLRITVRTTGFPTPTVAESGALPQGVTFTPGTKGTANLSGVPASGTAGTYDLLITATNGAGTGASQGFVLTVKS